MSHAHKVLTAEDVNIYEKKRCFDGFFKIDRWWFDHKRFDGSVAESLMREIIIRDGAVAVLPYDPSRDEILLIEQLRVATIGKSESPWLIELIAGVIDREGERLEEVAMREAKEEAGLCLTNMIPIYEYFNSAGGSSEKTYLFLALCALENAGGYYGLPEEHEDIHAFTLKREEAMAWLHEGKIVNASAIIALQWLNAEYKRFM